MESCVHCSNATLYQDGRLRCDTDNKAAKTPCWNIAPGRSKLFKLDSRQAPEPLKRSVPIKAALPKPKPPKPPKSRPASKGQPSLF